MCGKKIRTEISIVQFALNRELESIVIMASSFSLIKRSLSTSTARNAIKNVTVIGGGLMGSGIAQVKLIINYHKMIRLNKVG